MLAYEEINKMETEIMHTCHVDKLRMIGQDMGSQTTTLEACC